MSTPALELTGLTKRFGQLTAVNGIDLTINSGEVVALLGPNGAGKTTTTEMILALQKPDAGQVRVFGQSPEQASAAGRVGAMLQNGALLEQTRVLPMLKLVHAVQAHPLPLDEVIERAGLGDLLKMQTDKLSGGQAQRVRYGMAIMADPDLILLDEPTVAFDVETRRSFWNGMRDFAGQGRTVVFATHYLEEADEFADRVVVMRAGSIVADGTGASIKETVAGRVLSFSSEADLDWTTLPRVTEVTRVGARLQLLSSHSDATLRALLSADATAHDIEVSSPSLEDAFVELTA